MNNKIAMVNRELHTRLFDLNLEHEQEEQHPRIQRRQPLPPQLLLKSMIRKGLTNTQMTFHSRPKTAQTTFKRYHDDRLTADQLRSTTTAQL